MKIEEKLNNYKRMKTNCDSINQDIKRQYDEFKKFMEPQEKILNEMKQNLDSYNKDNYISVNFMDLINELSNNSKEYIYYYLKTNLKVTNDKKICKTDTNLALVQIYLKNYDPYSNFYYTFEFYNDIDEEFLSHCEIIPKIKNNILDNDEYSLIVSKNLENFNVKLDLEYLSDLNQKGLLKSLKNIETKNEEKVKTKNGR